MFVEIKWKINKMEAKRLDKTLCKSDILAHTWSVNLLHKQEHQDLGTFSTYVTVNNVGNLGNSKSDISDWQKSQQKHL